ncbi:hypothetical protein F2Q69_00031871 [Brassica cretica]|uniref:Uncharacterized protein n=1 Tax=Brassica cretica TaxID=69181 RepID=A0A8S9RVW6_BRACR|nr:hypothetical protein F2Q69_00031871 [Brassica cretica]
MDTLRKKLTPTIQSFGCLSQVLVQSQSRRVMKKTAKVLIVMPKNMRSSQKGKCIHLLLFLCIFYKIADWF